MMRIGKIESIEATSRENPLNAAHPLSVLYKVKVKPIATDGLGTEGMRRVTIKSPWYSTDDLNDGYAPKTFRIARIGNMAELTNPAQTADPEIEPITPDPAEELLAETEVFVAEVTLEDIRPVGPLVDVTTLEELNEINALNRAAPLNNANANGDIFTTHEMAEQYTAFFAEDEEPPLAPVPAELF